MMNEFLSMKLAGDILDARTQRDMTFRQLSEELGIDKMKLHALEVGNTMPKADELFSICQWIGKPMDSYFQTKNRINGNSKKEGSAKGAKTPGAKLVIGHRASGTINQNKKATRK